MSDWRDVLERAQAAPPDSAALAAVLEAVAPGRSINEISRMHGGLGAVLHRIDLDASAPPGALVLRRLMPEWGETAVQAAREATTVDRLGGSSEVPVPRIYWRDPDGRVFGRPAILMEFVSGRCLLADLDSLDGTTTLAETLAGIHGASVSMDHLPRFDSPAAHPQILGINPAGSHVIDADRLRDALDAALPDGRTEPTLVHGEESAARFRSAYREFAGEAPDPAQQRFWDLTALVRALPSPAQWLDSYRHAGATTLTGRLLEDRYADLAERVI